MLSVFCLFGLALSAPAMAQPEQPFTMATLKAAQSAGRSILVDAYAPWCPICRKQAPTIEAMTKDPTFAKLLILRLDYDNQNAEKQALGITMQSTLIAFDGSKETGRLIGVTDSAQIESLAKSAMP